MPDKNTKLKWREIWKLPLMMDEDKWKIENKVSMNLTRNKRRHDVRMFTLKIKRKNKFAKTKREKFVCSSYIRTFLLKFHVVYFLSPFH